MPSLYGGIIIGVISAVPGLNIINCLCCAGVLLGGALSVFFFKKDLPPQYPLTNGDAIQLGALSGVFGAINGTAISAAILAAFGNIGREFIAGILEGMKDQIPPEAFDRAMHGMENGAITIFHFGASLLIDTLFGLLGGLIGFAIWKPKPGFPMQPPTTFPPPPQVPPAAPHA